MYIYIYIIYIYIYIYSFAWYYWKVRDDCNYNQKSKHNSTCFITKVLNIIHKQLTNLYQNDKEIKPRYQVIRYSEFHLNVCFIFSLFITNWCFAYNGIVSFFRQVVQDALVPRQTKTFAENHSFECQIDLTGKYNQSHQ